MTKKAKILIKIFWLTEHITPERQLGEFIAGELTNPEGYIVAKASNGSIILFFNDNTTDADKIKKDLDKVFIEEFSEESSPFTITVSDLDDGDSQLLASLLKGKFADKKDIFDDTEKYSEKNRFEKLKNDVDDMMKKLVGASEFKDLINEIVQIAPELKRKDTFDVFMHRCYLFSIGDGCGLSTYLKKLGEVLEKTKLCELSSNAVREVEFKKNHDVFDDADLDSFRTSVDKSVCIVCIDISKSIESVNSTEFREMLYRTEKYENKAIFIFRVPFLEKFTVKKIEKDLSDILTVKTISIPPLTSEEMRTYANSVFNSRGFSVDDTAWKYFDQKINEEKSDGRFYGLNTVNKVVKEIIYAKQLENALGQSNSDEISAENIQSIFKEMIVNNLSGEEELAQMIGTDAIKEKVKEIIAQIKFAMKTSKDERPCIHMKFVGNPGTGKTTVARIIGKILYENGILRVGNFYEHMSRDLCGKFIGETAPKTSNICRDALGSVLFIDEAYSLYRGDERDNKDYGREALDTLIAEMENHRNDIVIILAGYTDEMEKLMDGNVGLRSRIPYTIEFPNFTREQLYEIFIKLVGDKFEYDEGLKESAKKYFDSIPDNVLNAKTFANARFVRNLYERTWAKASMRCQLEEKTTISFNKDDFDRATNEKEFKFTDTNKKPKIGF